MADEQFNCLDCSESTMESHEYYMVYDKLWFSAVPDGKGMLCFSCLEGRIGRSLTWDDFIDAPINFIWKAAATYGE